MPLLSSVLDLVLRPVRAAVELAAAVRNRVAGSRPVSREVRLYRAGMHTGGGYGLGCGGTDPAAPSPFGPYRARTGESAASVKAKQARGRIWCDCSGWISWVIGVPRRRPGYAKGWGYVSTDGLVVDADDPAVELVEWVPIGGAVEAGELLVYGGVDTDGDGDRDLIGHVGIVLDVPIGWVYNGPASLAHLTVRHCAASGGGGIRTSNGAPWAKRGRVLRVVD